MSAAVSRDAGPRFSVVVPAYNVEKFLGRCLDTLVTQTHKPLEILVIEDGATDATPRIAADYAARHPIIRVIHQENAGLGAVRNRGVDEARGDYIVFVDSDDALRKDALDRAARRIRATSPDFVFYGFSWWHGPGHRPRPRPWPTSLAGRRALRGADTELLLVNNWYAAWQGIFRKDFLTANGLRNGEGYLYEDQEFTVEAILAAEHVELVEAPLYWYFWNPDSILRHPSPAMVQRRIEGRRISSEHIVDAVRRRRASDQAKAYLIEHEYYDLIPMYLKDDLPFVDRQQILHDAITFFLALEPSDLTLLSAPVRELFESGAMVRRDEFAVIDSLHRVDSQEFTQITRSFPYRVARKLGNIRAGMLGRPQRMI